MNNTLRAAALVVISLVALVPSAPTHAQAPVAPARAAPAPQRWKGEITLPGAKLEFILALTPAAAPESASAKLSIPLQGLTDQPLRDVRAPGAAPADGKPGVIAFTLAEPNPKAGWAYFTLTPAEDGRTAKGVMRQAGREFPVTMSVVGAQEQVGPRRPQLPVPPFPYAQREVSYTNAIDGAKLAGTLTIPEEARFGKGPHPAVLLITGSGAQDRDESLLGHKPFAVIADRLTREGLAVLRVDDRGVGGSTAPKLGGETTEDFVGDALAGVKFLGGQPEVDPARIGLVGHSEGGVIAPMAAARAPKEIAFIVMLAGTGVSGGEVLATQMRAMARAEGMGDDLLDRQEVVQRRLLRLVSEGAGDDALKAAIESLARVQMDLPAEGEIPAAKRELFDSAVNQGLRQLGSPWMRAFIRLDPRDALRKVRCPVLALNGALDTQVLADVNAPEVRKALAEGGADATVEVLPGLNHLFQTCRTGALSEYAEIEETFAPAALDRLSTWLRERAKVAAVPVK